MQKKSYKCEDMCEHTNDLVLICNMFVTFVVVGIHRSKEAFKCNMELHIRLQN